MAATVDIDVEPGATTTADVGAAGAQAGLTPADGGAIVSQVFGGINQGISVMHQAGAMRTLAQTEPCSAAGFIREIRFMAVLPKMDWRHYWADRAAAFLGDWVRESLAYQGRQPPGSGLRDGKELALYLLETLGPEKIIPPVALGLMAPLVAVPGVGPLALLAAHVGWVTRHLPPGPSLADASWRTRMQNWGERLSPGVYLGPQLSENAMLFPEREGTTYTGNTIRSAIDSWINFQIENVTGTDWNGLDGVRTTLVKMVGTYRGSGNFGLWMKHDGADPGSRVANIDSIWNEMIELETEASDLCTLEWGLDQQLREREQSLTEQEALAAIELAKKEAARRDKLVLGGLGVVALFALTQ